MSDPGLLYNYTFTGFGTQVTLDGCQTICTGATVNFGQKIINSQGSFAGGVSFFGESEKSDKTIQTNNPLRMDVPDITVDLSFQMTADLFATFLTLLEQRKTKRSVVIQGAGGKLTLSNCYWNKISLQVQQNSLMTGSVSFNVIQEYSTVYNYVMFARNSNATNTTNFGLYGENFNCYIIPYYATAVKINGNAIKFSGLDDPTAQGQQSSGQGQKGSIGEPKTDSSGGINFIPMSWSLDVSQQISTRTFCKNIPSSNSSSTNSSLGGSSGVIQLAKKPSHIAFGMLSCNLNVTSLVDAGEGVKLSNLKPYISAQSNILTSTDYISVCCLNNKLQEKDFIKLEFLQLVSAIPNYTDTSNYMSVQLNYQANKLTIVYHPASK